MAMAFSFSWLNCRAGRNAAFDPPQGAMRRFGLSA
jgi:hypothetical protein